MTSLSSIYIEKSDTFLNSVPNICTFAFSFSIKYKQFISPILFLGFSGVSGVSGCSVFVFDNTITKIKIIKIKIIKATIPPINRICF